jgi:hypothetical protein
VSKLLIQIPGTDVELTYEQANALVTLKVEHPNSTWHMADCGCCVCLHPEGDSSKGWLIGQDGKADYLERAHS